MPESSHFYLPERGRAACVSLSSHPGEWLCVGCGLWKWGSCSWQLFAAQSRGQWGTFHLDPTQGRTSFQGAGPRPRADHTAHPRLPLQGTAGESSRCRVKRELSNAPSELPVCLCPPGTALSSLPSNFLSLCLPHCIVSGLRVESAFSYLQLGGQHFACT